MENLSLVSSPKLVLGLSPNHRSSVFITKPLLGYPRNFSPRKPSAFPLPFSCQGVRRGKTIVLAKLKGDRFAGITSSNGQQTTSIGANPLPVQPPPSQVGSPLFWVGVGVALSAVFSWVAGRLKNHAEELNRKMLMGLMTSQLKNAGFSPDSPFPFPPAPSAGTSPFPYAPAPSTGNSGSPPPVSTQSATVDVAATKVEEPPATDVKDDSEPRKQPKKYSFVDVSPGETFQKSAFESYKESVEADSSKDPIIPDNISSNGAAFKQEESTSQASSSSGQANSPLSVEALEKMLEDPTVQKMVYPYLPEEMRNPSSFKWMLQNPMYRQQLQEMLNNMGGSPDWDSRMLDNLKNFDLNSPEIKQQFDQIGLTPEEVISKIMANPDVAMAFQNPRVQAAIMDCSQNPMSITKYQNDKEVMDVFDKISQLFPGTTGF